MIFLYHQAALVTAPTRPWFQDHAQSSSFQVTTVAGGYDNISLRAFRCKPPRGLTLGTLTPVEQHRGP
ncbi:hypothetical protein BGW80DRAFT_1328626 [Lactifluus volemus]|nr:hypothetical protein BGW80DRAFT_1328626 [Lactifluus volemus]